MTMGVGGRGWAVGLVGMASHAPCLISSTLPTGKYYPPQSTLSYFFFYLGLIDLEFYFPQ